MVRGRAGAESEGGDDEDRGTDGAYARLRPVFERGRNERNGDDAETKTSTNVKGRARNCRVRGCMGAADWFSVCAYYEFENIFRSVFWSMWAPMWRKPIWAMRAREAELLGLTETMKY